MWGRFYPNAWLGNSGFSKEGGGEEMDAGEATHVTPPQSHFLPFLNIHTLLSS